MSSSKASLFELWNRRGAGYDLVHAVAVTKENAQQLSAIVQGTVTGFDPAYEHKIVLTFLGPAKTGVHDAELGDYVVSDMVGGFIAVDKEMFETHYTRST